MDKQECTISTSDTDNLIQTYQTPIKPSKINNANDEEEFLSMDVVLSPEYQVMRHPTADNTMFLDSESPIVVLDWDDTLLCTKQLKQQGISLKDPNQKIPPELQVQLEQLAIKIESLLNHIFSFTPNVHMVTCSTRERCEQTCQRFLPTIFPLLKKINCVSARDYATSIQLKNKNLWKQSTFEMIFSNFLNTNYSIQRSTRFICIGDNQLEHKGIRQMLQNNNNSISVCIKLDRWPSIERMIEQLQWIQNNFVYICRMKKNLYSLLPKQ